MDNKKLDKLTEKITALCEKAGVSIAAVLINSKVVDEDERVRQSHIRSLTNVDRFDITNALEGLAAIELDLLNQLRKHPEYIPSSKFDNSQELKQIPLEDS